MRKWLYVLAASAVLAVGSQALAGDTIKIGLVEPLSGGFKDVGDRYAEGGVYAAKVINENGGLLGKKVEIVLIDSELKADVASRKVTKKILKDGIKFFGGGTGSSVGGALSGLMQKHNTIFFSYGMEAASLTGEKCNKNFFRPGINTDSHSYALAHWVKDKGFKKVFTVAQDYSFGQQAVTAFKRKLKEISPDIEIVGEVFHPIYTKDFAPYVSQIISSGAELVFTPNWGSDLSMLIKQARPLGLKAKFACYFLNDETAIAAIGNDEAVIGSVAAENYMLSAPGDVNKKFIDKFTKDNGYPPSWIRGKSYSAVMFLAEAIKKAGTEDVDAVIKAWEGLSYETPAGTWTMRAYDHQAQMPIWTAEIVKDNPFYDHAYVGPATMVPADKIAVPIEETGCSGI